MGSNPVEYTFLLRWEKFKSYHIEKLNLNVILLLFFFKKIRSVTGGEEPFKNSKILTRIDENILNIFFNIFSCAVNETLN